jgi:hypothetical protein
VFWPLIFKFWVFTTDLGKSCGKNTKFEIQWSTQLDSKCVVKTQLFLIVILYTYIRMTHYKSFNTIFLTCKVSILSTNYQMTHHSQLSNHHYIMPHNLAWDKNFKMINLIPMIPILNSVFTVVSYVMRWIKLDTGCICFEEFIN